MNNYNKTELQLDGLDIDGLYLEDVFSVWEQFDRNGSRYYTVFFINNSRITVPGSAANSAVLYQGGHRVVEFVVNPSGVQEHEVAIPSASLATDSPVLPESS